MMGTMIEEMIEMRFAPPKITNAVIVIKTMPSATAVPLLA